MKNYIYATVFSGIGFCCRGAIITGMKAHKTIIAAIFAGILASGITLPAATDAKLDAARLKQVKDLPLPVATILNLKSQVALKGATYVFEGAVSMLNRRQASKYSVKKAGNGAFWYWVYALRTQGTRRSFFKKGKGHLVLINDKNQMVANVQVSLAKLCPT